MRHTILRLLAAAALVIPGALAGQSSTTDTRTTDTRDAVLTPGDSIRIQVWRKPELSGDFVIAPDGAISHPLYRSVRVAGLPFSTVEANVRTFLSTYEQNPQFVMEPLLRVAISGEVTRPQVFAVQPGTTIAEAVARAGGTTQNAKRNNVRLFRTTRQGQQSALTVDLTQPETGLATSPVRSGDLLVVDRRSSFFREVLVPVLGVIGSLASIAVLIERNTGTRN